MAAAHERARRDAIELRLRDGTPALLRPVVPEDRGRLAAGMRWLSPRSRYLRFHASVSELSDRQLSYLTQIDYHDHMAWIALDLQHPERPGMGVARYVRLQDDPTVAEAAVTVVDAYQGRGLGTILLGLLARTARERGVRVFRNYVLDGNAEMLEIFDQLGGQRWAGPDGIWCVDLRIPDDHEALPDTPAGRAFAQMAQRRHQLTWRFPPVWVSRRRRREAADAVARPDPRPRTGTPRERDDLAAWLDAALAEDADRPRGQGRSR